MRKLFTETSLVYEQNKPLDCPDSSDLIEFEIRVAFVYVYASSQRGISVTIIILL